MTYIYHEAGDRFLQTLQRTSDIPGSIFDIIEL